MSFMNDICDFYHEIETNINYDIIDKIIEIYFIIKIY